jgi:hypothetical protein
MALAPRKVGRGDRLICLLLCDLYKNGDHLILQMMWMLRLVWAWYRSIFRLESRSNALVADLPIMLALSFQIRTF